MSNTETGGSSPEELLPQVQESATPEAQDVEQAFQDLNVGESTALVLGEAELSEEKKQQILDELRRAASSAARVSVLAKWADTYGIEVIIGLVLPAVGDVVVGLILLAYYLFEGHYSGLDRRRLGKVLLYQMVDMAIGLVPVAGDVGDYLFKANVLSHGQFVEHFEDLARAAEEAGVGQHEIDVIRTAAQELTDNANQASPVVARRLGVKDRSKN